MTDNEKRKEKKNIKCTFIGKEELRQHQKVKTYKSAGIKKQKWNKIN